MPFSSLDPPHSLSLKFLPSFLRPLPLTASRLLKKLPSPPFSIIAFRFSRLRSVSAVEHAVLIAPCYDADNIFLSLST